MINIHEVSNIWFLIYSSLLFLTFANSVFLKSFKKDSLSILLLATLTILNHQSLQIIPYKHQVIINESITLIAILPIIFLRHTRKTAFILFASTVHLTSIALSHYSYFFENILAFSSGLLIFAITFSHFNTRNSENHSVKYLIPILILIQRILLLEFTNTLATWFYLIISFITALQIILRKEENIFEIFSCLCTLCISHFFINGKFVTHCEIIILSASTAFVLLHSSQKFHSKYSNIISAFFLVQICNIILNPNYFIIQQMHTPTITKPFFHFVASILFFTISALCFKILIKNFKKATNPPPAIYTVFLFICSLIMLEFQIVRNITTFESNSGLYFSLFFSTIFDALTLLLFYFGINLIESKVEGKAFLKLPKMQIPHFNLPNFLPHIKILAETLTQNINTLHRISFLIIPLFLAIYLIPPLF